MDTRKVQIKQLNEQVRESGDIIRQLQKGINSSLMPGFAEIMLDNQL